MKQRMQKNADSTAWGILEERWEMIVKAAEEQEASYQQGGTYARHDREAGHELQKLAKSVPTGALIETTLALYLMQQEQPRRFKSDAAFDYQLARRIRGLTDANAGSYWDHEAQRMKRVYRDLAPRTIVAFSQHVKLAFGVAGVFVAKLERQEAEQKHNQQAALIEALENLK